MGQNKLKLGAARASLLALVAGLVAAKATGGDDERPSGRAEDCRLAGRRPPRLRRTRERLALVATAGTASRS